MNRRFLLFAAALVLVGTSAVLGFYWYANTEARLKPIGDEDLYKMARAMGNANEPPAQDPTLLDPKRIVRLAVGSLGVSDDEQNGRISDLLLVQLSGANGLEMIDRQSLEKVLGELHLNLSGLVRAKDVIQAGNLVRADWFLLGTPLRSANSNSIVVRIVDARNGIFRDTAIFPLGQSPQRLAQDVAAFVSRCRTGASTVAVPVYVALGSFQDLSLNDRLADFPVQLRSWLTAAYQGSRFTMLERDHVETLLQELRLDLAGLTERSEQAAPMQTAFWLVEGDYQSYNSQQLQVEVDLHINRIFGRSTNTLVRAPPGDPICRQVKSVLDAVITDKPKWVVPSRRTEVSVQMSRGRELVARAVPKWHDRELTEQEARLNRRRLEEAIRAFQTVLILDPTDRDAKTSLGSCYCDDLIGQFDRGRALLREVMEQNFNDTAGQTAALHLYNSFGWGGERSQWFATAEKQTANTNLQAYYHARAEEAREAMLRSQGAASQPEGLAEKKLLQDISSAHNVLHGRSGDVNSDLGLSDYVYFFRPDKTTGGHKVAAILPRLITSFPDMAPHLAAAALQFQFETNNPVLPEFQRQLERYRAHPGDVLAPSDFWSRARHSAFDWCMNNKLYPLAVQIMELMRDAAQATNRVSFGDEEKMTLAFAYEKNEQWREALTIFESYSNLPVRIGNSGPWGGAFASIATDKQAAYCREKLGQSRPVDPREFDIGPACFSCRSYLTFAADTDGVWLGYAGNLVHLDIDLRTNLHVRLPTLADVNCLALAPTKIWVGTDGGGLLEYDKQTGQLTQYTEQHGLLSDAVASLCLAGDTLWIGHGVKTLSISRELGGGLAKLDLVTRKFHAFTPSLARNADVIKEVVSSEPLDSAPHRPVRAIAVSPQNEIWFSAWGSPLRRYQPATDTWDGVAGMSCAALASDGKRLVIGHLLKQNKDPQLAELGVGTLSFADHQWSSLTNFNPLPSGVGSALAIDGDCIWVGGASYIAKIDPARNEVRSFCRVSASTIDRLQVAAGYLWAQYEWHIYRFPLSHLP